MNGLSSYISTLETERKNGYRFYDTQKKNGRLLRIFVKVPKTNEKIVNVPDSFTPEASRILVENGILFTGPTKMDTDFIERFVPEKLKEQKKFIPTIVRNSIISISSDNISYNTQPGHTTIIVGNRHVILTSNFEDLKDVHDNHVFHVRAPRTARRKKEKRIGMINKGYFLMTRGMTQESKERLLYAISRTKESLVIPTRDAGQVFKEMFEVEPKIFYEDVLEINQEYKEFPVFRETIKKDPMIINERVLSDISIIFFDCDMHNGSRKNNQL